MMSIDRVLGLGCMARYTACVSFILHYTWPINKTSYY